MHLDVGNMIVIPNVSEVFTSDVVRVDDMALLGHDDATKRSWEEGGTSQQYASAKCLSLMGCGVTPNLSIVLW